MSYADGYVPNAVADSVTKATEALDDINLVLMQLEYALTEAQARGDNLQAEVDTLKLQLFSCRRIIRNLGHQTGESDDEQT
jgi:hypothetical protein